MPATQTNASDLRSLMERDALFGPGLCKVTIRNALPANLGVVISKVGTKFFYRSGKDYTDGPLNTDIKGPSGEITMSNNDPSECVFQEQSFIEVRVPGHPPAIFQAIEGVGPNECLLAVTHKLVPKKKITERDLKSKDLASFLELVAE